MFRIVVLMLLVLGSIMSASAQQYSVHGKLEDTLTARPVVYASVAVIKKEDSVLQRFVRTNEKGEFMLPLIKAGKYIIIVAHETYIDYVDDIEVTEELKNLNLGTLSMYQREKMLREVVIRNSAAIKIKGDTLEYAADSFKVRQGAMVEDLLKVLPGIQVNKKGEITAMGETVQKVLVDGEEFFGDDPTVATQNIQSAVVEKVQVFDRKSDQANFTGFDDGEQEKTINLKLKKDMNKGVFGKIEAGGGWDDRWNNQAMINSFKNKRQMSAYGLMSSNGKTGLGWEDRNTYTGSGGGMQMDEDGGFMWNFSSDDDDFGGGRSVPEGITKAWTGGARYANKWDENKHQFNTNYSVGQINREQKENSFRENIFPNNKYFTRDTSNSQNNRNTHRLSVRYTWNPDTSTSIIYNANARISFIESETYNSTQNISATDAPISQSSRTNESSSMTSRASNNITVNRKLNKPGRTLSLAANYVYSNNEGEGLLTGNNAYFLGGINVQEQLDQRKDQQQLNNNINADISFTESLTKKILLKTSYGFGLDANDSRKTTLVKNNPMDEEYSKRIDSLSSDFTSQIWNHTVGAELKYVEKKYNITMGTRVRYSIFDQDDLVRNLAYDYTRVNLFPTIRFNYKFDQFSRLNFTYSGATRQPSITQLQPVQDNSNPLELYIGNPDLKIGFNQNFNLTYFNYKVITSRSLYAGINFSNNFNNIALNRSFDEFGRTINQYVNLNGGYNGSMWGGINGKIPKTELTGKFNVAGNFNHAPNIFNNERGITNTVSMTLTPGLMYNKEEKIFLDFDLGTIYSFSRNKLQTNRDIQFLSFVPSASVVYYLPKNIELATDADYVYNPPVGPYATSFSRLIWNASVAYRMLENKNLTWRFAVNDLLNQNRGYDRTTTNNFNSERNFMTLSRYWMISALWTFNSGPMAAAQQGSSGMRPPGMPRMRGGTSNRRRR